MAKDPGQLVKTKDDKWGRTKRSSPPINGKIVVYLATETGIQEGFEYPRKFSDKGILCDPETLTGVGMID